jgi:hypothetical protein
MSCGFRSAGLARGLTARSIASVLAMQGIWTVTRRTQTFSPRGERKDRR